MSAIVAPSVERSRSPLDYSLPVLSEAQKRNRPTILYVHNTGDLYGASRSLLRLTRRVQESGFRAVVVLPCAGPLDEALRRNGVTVLIDSRLSIVTPTQFRGIMRVE